MAYTPNGKYVISAGSDCVRVWDAQSAKKVKNLGKKLNENVATVAVSPDSRYLVACGAFAFLSFS